MIIDKGKKVKVREKSTLKARASLPIKEATWRERRRPQSSVKSSQFAIQKLHLVEFSLEDPSFSIILPLVPRHSHGHLTSRVCRRSHQSVVPASYRSSVVVLSPGVAQTILIAFLVKVYLFSSTSYSANTHRCCSFEVLCYFPTFIL